MDLTQLKVTMMQVRKYQICGSTYSLEYFEDKKERPADLHPVCFILQLEDLPYSDEE